MSEEQLYGQLSTVTDDEYFEALANMPPVRDMYGREVDVVSDVIDARGEANA